MPRLSVLLAATVASVATITAAGAPRTPLSFTGSTMPRTGTWLSQGRAAPAVAVIVCERDASALAERLVRAVAGALDAEHVDVLRLDPLPTLPTAVVIADDTRLALTAVRRDAASANAGVIAISAAASAVIESASLQASSDFIAAIAPDLSRPAAGAPVATALATRSRTPTLLVFESALQPPDVISRSLAALLDVAVRRPVDVSVAGSDKTLDALAREVATWVAAHARTGGLWTRGCPTDPCE